MATVVVRARSRTCGGHLARTPKRRPSTVRARDAEVYSTLISTAINGQQGAYKETAAATLHVCTENAPLQFLLDDHAAAHSKRICSVESLGSASPGLRYAVPRWRESCLSSSLLCSATLPSFARGQSKSTRLDEHCAIGDLVVDTPPVDIVANIRTAYIGHNTSPNS